MTKYNVTYKFQEGGPDITMEMDTDNFEDMHRGSVLGQLVEDNMVYDLRVEEASNGCLGSVLPFVFVAILIVSMFLR